MSKLPTKGPVAGLIVLASILASLTLALLGHWFLG